MSHADVNAGAETAPPATSADPVPSDATAGHPPTASRQTKDRAVALLLAAAAVVAAVLATWASFTTSSATSSWQAAVRAEIKRSAATIEDVRRTFGDDASLAYEITEAHVREEEFRAAAARLTEPQQVEALLREAAIQAGITNALRPSSEVASDQRYALPDGGYDLIQRLADNRAANPQLAEIDPDVDQAAGDRMTNRAGLIVAAGIPVGAALLLGAMAKAFGRYRRPLLAIGAASLALAILFALAVVVVA